MDGDYVFYKEDLRWLLCHALFLKHKYYGHSLTAIRFREIDTSFHFGSFRTHRNFKTCKPLYNSMLIVLLDRFRFAWITFEELMIPITHNVVFDIMR